MENGLANPGLSRSNLETQRQIQFQDYTSRALCWLRKVLAGPYSRFSFVCAPLREYVQGSKFWILVIGSGLWNPEMGTGKVFFIEFVTSGSSFRIQWHLPFLDLETLIVKIQPNDSRPLPRENHLLPVEISLGRFQAHLRPNFSQRTVSWNHCLDFISGSKIQSQIYIYMPFSLVS